MKRFAAWLRHIEGYVTKPWYPLLLGALAGADHFVVVIPTDGLLVTSLLAARRRAISLVFWLTIGSTAGAVALALLVHHFGHPLVESLFPGIHETTMWRLSARWMADYGLWALAVVFALPVVQQPVVVLAALGGLAIPQIALAILGGRLFKYSVIAWAASHAPRLLFRSKTIRKEVAELDPHTVEAAGDPPQSV